MLAGIAAALFCDGADMIEIVQPIDQRASMTIKIIERT